MKLRNLFTEYASPERDTKKEIKKLSDRIKKNPFFSQVLDSISIAVLVLNKHRQIVFANKSFLNFLGMPDLGAIISQRPGEALDCEHAKKNHGGCGTSEFCKNCGAVNSILVGIKGTENTEECRISTTGNKAYFDLRVTSAPFKDAGDELIIFSVVDISHEKRRAMLERIFFHDILNLAGGIKGVVDLISKDGDRNGKKYPFLASRQTDELINEIKAQRDLLYAENKELLVKKNRINSKNILTDVRDFYLNHKSAADKQIILNSDTQSIDFENDRTLLSRVLSNMLKNALEASEDGQKVSICAKKNDTFIQFSVHNQTVIPKDVQLQIFQRSFTTKGEGRGLGTYSMKLLTENYLKGKISFESSEIYGTIFMVDYPINIKLAN